MKSNVKDRINKMVISQTTNRSKTIILNKTGEVEVINTNDTKGGKCPSLSDDEIINIFCLLSIMNNSDI